MTEDRAKRLQDLMERPGWADLLAMRDEAIAANRDTIERARSPKSETTAFSYSMRVTAHLNQIQGLRDFFDEVLDATKILTPTREGGKDD